MSKAALSAIVALPVLAFVQFALVAPASAHRLHHHYVSRQAFEVSGQGWQGASLYNYAPAYQQQEGWRVRGPRSAFDERSRGASPEIDGMASSAASAAGIPASLVARVIKRESGGNPRAVSSGNYGLMQIRLGTARAMGYSGSVEGLLDAQTNMTYAVKYLAGAYRAAGGNEDRAVALYARGYHDVAKTQSVAPYETARSEPRFASYEHVADAGPGFSSGYDEPAVRVRHHHHRRGV